MASKTLKTRSKTSAGHEVAEILGQGPAGAVYFSTSNEIRWAYHKNKGTLPSRLGLVIARFDLLLADIKSVPATPGSFVASGKL